jgi:outer membrane murein-binding lipoprotein Lpp
MHGRLRRNPHTLIAVVAGGVFYLMADPFFQDIRQHHVLTKSDLDSVSTEFRELSARVEHMERSRPATVDDLEKLKAALEQEIQAIKSGTKAANH